MSRSSPGGSQQRQRQGSRLDRARQGGYAVSLPEAARRLGYSADYARRLVAQGRFPVPELPRLSARAHHRYSTVDLDRFLSEAATQDVG